MKMSFYPKLAAGNMKKNARTYVPYMLTCIITVAMYYIVKSLSQNPGVKEMIGGGYLSELMFIGSHVVALFAVIFLFYTNSFLVKRRKRNSASSTSWAWRSATWPGCWAGRPPIWPWGAWSWGCSWA